MTRSTLSRLHEHEAQLPKVLRTPAGAAVLADLLARYAEPGRHYHNLDHVLALLDEVGPAQPQDAPALILAVWFHDAVYDTRASDNEEQSAALARAALTSLGLPLPQVAEVVRLILLTRTHAAAADDRDGQLLLDADLAVLGAAPPTYDAYAAAIRREYTWVPEDAYRNGRRRVLETFLARSRIFHTERAFRAREEQARDNLRRECASLSAAS